MSNFTTFSAEWKKTSMGHIGTIYGGLSGKSKVDFGSGNARYVTFLGVLENVILDVRHTERVHVGRGESQNPVLKGDLLFNASSETPGDLAIGAVMREQLDNLYLNSFCFGFRIHDKNRYVPLFLAYFFRGTVGRDIMNALAQGATRYNMSKSQFRALELSIPCGDEQRAIAEALSDVDGLLNALEALIAKKQAIKQATMQQLLTGKTCLPGFSGAWERGILADFGVFQSGSGFPLAFQGHQSGDYPFFKVSDLSGEGNQLFMNRANHYISEDVRRKLGAIRFKPGSIVFAKIGAAIFLERKRLLSQESCLDNNMMAFTLTNDFACPRFFHYIFLHIELGKLVSTTALPALSGRHIGAVSILIPPLAEQQAISSILSDMDAEIAALEQRRDKTRAIKQGMMQQLLTGRVRLSESRICTDDTDYAD